MLGQTFNCYLAIFLVLMLIVFAVCPLISKWRASKSYVPVKSYIDTNYYDGSRTESPNTKGFASPATIEKATFNLVGGYNQEKNWFDTVREKVSKILAQPEDKYEVVFIPDFLTDEECEHLKKTAGPSLERSSVMSENDPISDIRTSSNTFISKSDSFVSNIYQRIHNIIGVPVINFEDMQVAHYGPNQEYKHHFDACKSDENELCRNDFKRGRYRMYTVLFYLNDVEEGGGTDFPKINQTVQPKKGGAVFFANLANNNTIIHPMSLHAGLPVKKGEKWIGNCWIRQEKFV